MKVKALLLGLVIATAHSFILNQDTVGVFAIDPSPLQPSATITAEELSKIENFEVPLEIEKVNGEDNKNEPLRIRLLTFSIFGIKVIPLILALITMAGLSFAFSRLGDTSDESIPPKEDLNRIAKPPQVEINKPKKGVVKKRGRPLKKTKKKPSKKRPRGRPRKRAAT